LKQCLQLLGGANGWVSFRKALTKDGELGKVFKQIWDLDAKNAYEGECGDIGGRKAFSEEVATFTLLDLLGKERQQGSPLLVFFIGEPAFNGIVAGRGCEPRPEMVPWLLFDVIVDLL
jgi:hypothetical protein